MDDDPDVRVLLIRALEETGYDVVAVQDGQAARVAQAEGAFDLVVANSFLSTAPGEHSVGHLRGLFPDLPILHLDDVKPFSLTALLRSVALAVAERPLRLGA